MNIPANMTTSDILGAIDTLCARLADNGEVDGAWKIRYVIDALESGIVDYDAGDEDNHPTPPQGQGATL